MRALISHSTIGRFAQLACGVIASLLVGIAQAAAPGIKGPIFDLVADLRS